MVGLADAVLPLIRTRAEVHRYGEANQHGRLMHEAVDVLERALGVEDPATVYAVTHKALASAITVIARADDSAGIIGDAVRRLLGLHPKVAAAARPSAATLVDWMIEFQFNGKVDYFTLDPVAYAPALGEAGVERYRVRLAEIATRLGPQPTASQRWSSPHRHEWYVLGWNEQRLSVLDRNVEAIIRTHARDRKVAAWFEDTARALAEIGENDLAIDWAKQATDFDQGHQAHKAAGYWCTLLAEHRPDELLAARTETFWRWPNASTAARLHADAGHRWPELRDETLDRLSERPREAVLFALLTLHDLALAWTLAHTLGLDDNDVWQRLAKDYADLDPLAVLPVLIRLVDDELTHTGAQHYRIAARHLAKMRRLATGTDRAGGVDMIIAELREAHRNRPRLQREFDRAGLP